MQGSKGICTALDLLNEAERLYIRGFSPEVRPVPAFKARVWVALGRLDEALGWARESDLSVEDDLSYLREFEHITLVKVLLAQHTTERRRAPLQEATRLLERLLRAAEDAARTGSVLEILVLQALAHQAQGDIPAALASLQRALTLAEPEATSESSPMKGNPWRPYCERPRKRESPRAMCVDSWQPSTRPRIRRPSTGLIEPLSDRELDVLGCLEPT